MRTLSSRYFPDADSKNPSNVKQMEYELTEARFQIEKLQKQVEANATKDDRSTLEGQINFLNDVIVELRNTNERLKKEMEFQRNPFAGTDDALSGNMTTGTRTYVARLYCKSMADIRVPHTLCLSPR